MRLEVKTCNQVRVLIDMAMIKSQRRIINGELCYCQVTLMDGKILDIEKPILEFPLDSDINISKKFLNRLTQKIVTDGKQGSVEDGQSVQSNQNHKI